MINTIIKQNIKNEPKLGFDIRRVSYEKIHVIDKNDFSFLVKLLKIKQDYKILDAGAGYGSITREILLKYQNDDINIYLTDIFKYQLELAVKKLNKQFGESLVLEKLRFNLETIEKTGYDDNFFDIVVAKMLLHELPIKSENTSENRLFDSLSEIYRVLKQNGKLFIWDVTLSNQNQELIQKIIRKKDELAGFEYLVKNRYLPTTDEWIYYLNKAKFKNLKFEKRIDYIFSTRLRLNTEFNGDVKKLISLNSYIRDLVNNYPENILKSIKYSDNGDDISFLIPKSIISALK